MFRSSNVSPLPRLARSCTWHAEITTNAQIWQLKSQRRHERVEYKYALLFWICILMAIYVSELTPQNILQASGDLTQISDIPIYVRAFCTNLPDPCCSHSPIVFLWLSYMSRRSTQDATNVLRNYVHICIYCFWHISNDYGGTQTRKEENNKGGINLQTKTVISV